MISTPSIKSISRELQAANHAANDEDHAAHHTADHEKEKMTAYEASKESTAP
jgi:hypothetical protein